MQGRGDHDGPTAAKGEVYSPGDGNHAPQSSEEILRREYQAEIARLRKAYEALRAERDQLQRSMLLIHTWLGRALEPKQDRFAIEQYVGLIEDAYNEASERVKLDA